MSKSLYLADRGERVDLGEGLVLAGLGNPVGERQGGLALRLEQPGKHLERGPEG